MDVSPNDEEGSIDEEAGEKERVKCIPKVNHEDISESSWKPVGNTVEGLMVESVELMIVLSLASELNQWHSK